MTKFDKFKIKKRALISEWTVFERNNSKDFYSRGVVDAVLASCKVLDDVDKTPKQAEEAWEGLGLTGFMAGCAAKTIAHFHVRGDEFRKYWNKQFGVDEKQAKGGTVNPAILTIEERP